MVNTILWSKRLHITTRANSKLDAVKDIELKDVGVKDISAPYWILSKFISYIITFIVVICIVFNIK